MARTMKKIVRRTLKITGIVLLVLIVVGVLLWLVNTYIPMDRKIKNILNVVVVIAVIIWLLKAFGLFNSLKNL